MLHFPRNAILIVEVQYYTKMKQKYNNNATYVQMLNFNNLIDIIA